MLCLECYARWEGKTCPLCRECYAEGYDGRVEESRVFPAVAATLIDRYISAANEGRLDEQPDDNLSGVMQKGAAGAEHMIDMARDLIGACDDGWQDYGFWERKLWEESLSGRAVLIHLWSGDHERAVAYCREAARPGARETLGDDRVFLTAAWSSK